MESQAARKQSLVWGGLLIFLGVVGLVETFTDLTAWVWVAVLVVGGLGAFGVYLTNRSNWGLLIPGYIMWGVAGLIGLTTLNILQDAFVATYVLSAIALPFLVVFLHRRDQWWALIPAYVLLVIGVMVGLLEVGALSDLLVPAYIMFAIAIPFFVVYARDPKQWWALIPGGIMAIIGLSFLLAEDMLQYVAPAVLILAGAWILVRQFTRRGEPTDVVRPPAPDVPAPPGPEADEPPAE